MSEALWYKVGGKARFLLTAKNREDILEALDFIDKRKPAKILVCGMGSNMIFSDEYYDGAVLQIFNEENEGNIQKVDEMLDAFAGTRLDEVIRRSFDEKMTGLEWAGGLPGTVGAAVRGNVGAFGGEIKDVVAEAEILEIGKKGFNTKKIWRDSLDFSYRNSLVKKNKLIVLSVRYSLKHSSEEKVEEKRKIYEENIEYRRTHHPMEFRSCGSVFKNISSKIQVEKVISEWPDIKDLVERRWHGKVSMGYIIKRLGLNEYRVGNMQVSPKHSNFIVNLGGAKAADVLNIISTVQEKVKDNLGFIPETEVEIVK